MSRVKGSPKTGGRKKGTPNKTTAELKKWVMEFVGSNVESFNKKFSELDVETQFNLIIKLLPYVLPRQQENKISIEEETTAEFKESMERIKELFK